MNDDKEDIYKVDDEDDYNFTDKNEEKEDFIKKLIKYAIIIFIIFVILVLLIAIFFPKKSTKKEEVVAKEVTLTSGDKYALDYTKGTYTWTSSNQSVATISSDGEIIGVKNGEATITIKSGKETVTYKVHVEKIDDAVTITNIKMEKNTVEIEKGKSYKMTVTFTPSNATSTELTWSSSNEKVATVKNGEITAVAPGTCMITVKSTNGNIDTCLVKVTGAGSYNPVESIKIDSTDVSLNKGTSYNLSYEIEPSESINLVTWESSDESIATVENGVVYALKGGETTVYAKSGTISKSVKVTVVGENKQEEKKAEFMLNQTEISMTQGETYTLGTNDSSIPLTWVSSNVNVATVDSSGNIKAVGKGEAIITAKTSNGSYYDCKVTVYAKEATPTQERDKITLNTSSLSMNVGDRVRLVETVTPSNNVSNVTWSSSDPSVATVSGGEVTAVKNGTTTITAKLPNGEKAECVVTVSTKVVNAALVTINATKITLSVGSSTTLSATVLPSNTTNKTITWSSSNTSVATVDQNGKVTAKGVGTAKIYARTNNGVFDSCGVVVQK